MNNTLDAVIIVVDEEPFCIWEMELAERNKEFLEGIDVGYWDYILNTNFNSDDEKRASIALRSAFHHSLETMFSLLGGFLQAPDCVYAWVAKCSNVQLRSVIRKITQQNSTLFTRFHIQQISWKRISELVFHCYVPGTEKNKTTSELYAKLWQKLAHEFLDEVHIQEYNSLKHGFRIKSGGFALAVGKEHEYGVPPPANEMQLLGESEHGTTFFKLEPIGTTPGNRSLRSRRISLNWKIEKIALLIQLVSMSIRNITSALQIINGSNPSELEFVRPTEDSDFDKPWQFSPGVTNCSFDFNIDEEQIVPTTKKELLKELKKIKKR